MESTLPLRAESEQHEPSDTEETEVDATEMEPLLCRITCSSGFFPGCICISSGTAKRLFPISGGLDGHKGRHPVTTKGLWMLVVMRTIWSMKPLSWGSCGKVKVNVDFRRWATFCPVLFVAVALATSSFRSGHSGTYFSQNCLAWGLLFSLLSLCNVSKRPVFTAHSRISFPLVASTTFMSAPRKAETYGDHITFFSS